MSIEIVTTGGTIDKVYDPLSGSMCFGKTLIPDLVLNGNLGASITPLFQVDSLEMSTEQRTQIVDHCRLSSNAHILLLHGTDTMTTTAEALLTAKLDKVIVITGAMIPASIEGSDAATNLGLAYGALQCSGPGVYIAMNGQVFWGDACEKDQDLGLFVPKS